MSERKQHKFEEQIEMDNIELNDIIRRERGLMELVIKKEEDIITVAVRAEEGTFDKPLIILRKYLIDSQKRLQFKDAYGIKTDGLFGNEFDKYDIILRKEGL